MVNDVAITKEIGNRKEFSIGKRIRPSGLLEHTRTHRQHAARMPGCSQEKARALNAARTKPGGHQNA